jgi:hypothetical protein
MTRRNPKSADLLAYPVHVTVQGVVDRNSNGNPLGIATLGEVVEEARPVVEVAVSNVPPNNIGMVRTDPRQDFYVREYEGDSLFGPLSMKVADSHARHISKLPERSGYAQVLTFVGERLGDPQQAEPVMFVVYTYVRGRRTMVGPPSEP